jgi:DNA-binding response OmpR family regulator
MSEKILIVDDDPDTVKFLGIFISRLGYEPLQALSGMQALELAHQHLPNLIILDVMMPNVDGYEVARSLRRHPETALIPILMLSAKTQVQDRLAGYDSGVDLYLTKPILPVDLQANIKAMLTRRHAQLEAQAKKGYLLGVLAAKGGLGASSVALNLAVAYKQKHQAKVVAVELRPGQGSWAEELGINVADGLSNLLSLSPTEITPGRIEQELQQTVFGIPLLLASNDSLVQEHLGAIMQFESILEGLGRIADLVVLDIGTNFHPAFDIFLNLSDELVLVTDSQPVTIKRTHPLLAQLRSKDFGSSKALSLLTVNRARSDMGMTVTQIEQALGHSVILGIPPAPELAFLAGSRMQPMFLAQPGGIISGQFDTLAEHIARHVAQKRVEN